MTDATATDDTVTAQQVAAMLKLSYDMFMATHRDLVRLKHFPAPLPLCPGRRSQKGTKGGRPPLRWSREAVRDWIRNPVPPRPANENQAAQRAAARLSAHDRDIVSERFGERFG
jgi:hypothetical protein